MEQLLPSLKFNHTKASTHSSHPHTPPTTRRTRRSGTRTSSTMPGSPRAKTQTELEQVQCVE